MQTLCENKRPHVVFIPMPAQSHIKCMLKLARLLHRKGLHITFVNTVSNHNLLLKSDGSHDLNGAPSFQFKTVPDGLASTWDGEREPIKTLDQVSKYLGTNFLDSFLDLVAGLDTPITCIICDGFMTFTKTPLAAEKLGVPIILFWTFAACGFMGFYQAKVLMEKGLVPLKDESYLTNGYLDTKIDVPGMEDIRLKDLPEHVYGLKPMAWALKFMAEAAHMADKVSHLLLDQVKETEATDLNSNGYSLWKEKPECVHWLESKEPNSVVYVNFGSLTVMSLQDLLEFGWGLVNSNYYFLFIIRHDLIGGGSAVFPQELEEAIKRKGLIASWCSQEEVLAHTSVGGFLTHGGWGSVIESLSAGVPMICWPFSGDQRTNCRQMCKEWEVGMEIGRNVKRGEVEKLVRELMEGVEGRKMRNKAMDWKKMAEIATGPNGSSSQNIEKLVNKIRI
uniref:Glycosyltransferase n=1 Tax=Tanacetum cinerariifolium TaxID=118510 RepID=A0A699JUU4_TANCI|nr:UDP-glycosyltransferase 85C1-like [Tanacetum cinerariifolium]